MSILTRATAPAAAHEAAAAALALLSRARAPATLSAPEPVPVVARSPHLPSGLGTSAVRMFLPDNSTRPRSEPSDSAVPQLYCPPAIRDDVALGEEVNNRLVDWAEEIGIYPGKLDLVRRCDFGRLIMLAHPESDDPDRLLAAARCALAEWSVDDHYVDGEAAESDPEKLGQTLALAYTAIAPAHLPQDYAPQLAEYAANDPVMRALDSAMTGLADIASNAQVTRLQHELSVMFVAYNQEAVWRAKELRPSVWEFLAHRHENSFLPCMQLIDPVAGYEIPYEEFTAPAVRRVFTLAGTASVIVNDLYSMGKEDPTDTNLPRLIAAEEGCSLREAIERSAQIHDELMHTFEEEAARLALTGSPMLHRFLTGLWAWMGGSREWHAGSGRYHNQN